MDPIVIGEIEINDKKYCRIDVSVQRIPTIFSMSFLIDEEFNPDDFVMGNISMNNGSNVLVYNNLTLMGTSYVFTLGMPGLCLFAHEFSAADQLISELVRKSRLIVRSMQMLKRTTINCEDNGNGTITLRLKFERINFNTTLKHTGTYAEYAAFLKDGPLCSTTWKFIKNNGIYYIVYNIGVTYAFDKYDPLISSLLQAIKKTNAGTIA